MNVDKILSEFNQHGVQYLMIGGMNFMLRHQPILTYDLDLRIEDSDDNRTKCEAALAGLDAEWGATEQSWGPVTHLPSGWLTTQDVFCLSSPHGAIDVFRAVRGLDDWRSCATSATPGSTSAGISYHGISDEDMLRCQLALESTLQKQERIGVLRQAILRKGQLP